MSVAQRNSQDMDVSGVKRKQPDDEGFSEGYQIPSKFYITLAKESPRESICCESDDATYDSFHGRETDLCRDTSDTDTDDTSGEETTIAVLEYEVATDSSSSGNNLYSDESSSGTEHEVVIAALTTWMADDSSSGSDFAIFADTEASDGSATDPELRRADYWECVKCKNKQNNPLYRYCEKCYQIRKNHFPPRPKRRKKRSKRKTKDRRKGQYDQTMKSPSTSDEEETVRMEQHYESGGKRKDGCKMKCRNHETATDGKSSSVKGRKCHLTRERCKVNSGGETVESDEEVSAGGSTKGGSLDGDTRSCVNNGSNCDGGNGDVGHSSLGDRKRRSSRISRDLLLEEDEEEEEEEEDHNGAVISKKARLDCRFENKFFKNVMEQQSEESGVLSCTSSQELSPMSSLATILPESQETFCEELELERAKVLNPLTDDVWEVANKNEQIKDHLDERENLGRCIMCLEEPKNGVFVHSRFLHLCCCYKCAVKVWNKHKRCPICNSKVKNVLKLFVH